MRFSSQILLANWRYYPAMAENFFSGQASQDQYDSGGITLLSGPPSCGKTSLLFQYAFNSAAAEKNGEVVFICNRRRFESKPPFLSQGVDSTNSIFKRVQIKYVEDEEGIKKYFAAFHFHDAFPTAIVIDDFGDFFDDRICQDRYGNPRGRDLAMVRTLALCQNALDHANEIGPCKLLLSDTHHGDSPRLLYIYKRWIKSIFTVKGDGSGSFLLQNIIRSGSGRSGRQTARYSIALQYLLLEGITEDVNSYV